MYLLLMVVFLESGAPTTPTIQDQFKSRADCEQFLHEFSDFSGDDVTILSTTVGRVTAVMSTDDVLVYAACAKDERGDEV